MKHTIIGTLAHVDAGKTTLSESLLYQAGSIRKSGRVDHGDAFLDYDKQEKQRGITIFSKQAILTTKDVQITLLDTPGHVDFSAEMERTLEILDYAILVISGVDGVQTHSETIWKLLQHYHIPTFLFVNKMDISYQDKDTLMKQLYTKLDAHCVDFTDEAQKLENIALCEDSLLQLYMENQTIDDEVIQDAICERTLFPCYFGSALKMQGIDLFLNDLGRYCKEKRYPETFGAKVFKITRDGNGNRLTHMKITGGSLKAKTRLQELDKVDQIRKYSGVKFQGVQEVFAGEVCAVSGLQSVQAGEGLGFEQQRTQPVLSAFMCYRVCLPDTCDVFTMMKYLQILNEEDPQLHVVYHAHSQQIFVQVMGEIQIEILTNLIMDRFQVAVRFEEGGVNYKETISAPVEGVGHYEPLRHYAEVHVLLEPTERGTGIQIASACSEDQLDAHIQRLILSHIEEQAHPGVLTGSSITDMKITLLAGKAHKKHTEGGDFRQATYRAIRQGLKMASSVLLEPFYQFRLVIPSSNLSKAIYDLEQMHGSYQILQEDGERTILTGSAPVSLMQNYGQQVRSYTKGAGSFFCSLKGYERAIDEASIIETIGYDSERDLEHPTGSIFCAQGAGYFVPWNEVYEHMHIKKVWHEESAQQAERRPHRKIQIDDAELARVVAKIHGPQKPRTSKKKETITPSQSVPIKPKEKQCLLVDGYNMIFSWKELKELARHDLAAARKRLIDLLCNYQGYKQMEIILVFDAYKVDGNPGEIRKQDNLYIVYTKSKQTADMYIEQATHTMANQYQVIVATSDGMEQLIVMGQGAQRLSARELEMDLNDTHKQEQKEYQRLQPQYRNHALEKIRKLNEEDEEV